MTTEPAPPDDPALGAIVDRIRAARAAGTKLRLRGGGSKDFYGGPLAGEVLDLRPLAGISRHEPTELVVSARAGTPLAELEEALAAHGQWLPFEPPRFGPGTTVGGMVAAGLAGPARASQGSVRDYVLGATLLDGRGELLGFGGQVMKNVAGYDVSRLLTGSMGILGVICEVSFKIMPRPPGSATLRFDMDEATALRRLAEWSGQPLPLSASAWWDGTLVLRLAGAHAAVDAAAQRLGGEAVEPALAASFWEGLRDQRDEFFAAAGRAVAGGAALWRLALPSTAPPLRLTDQQLIEWGGAQRWLCCALPAATVRDAAASLGGHATLWRGGDRAAGVFAPLAPALARIHRELKRAFDPDGVFNPGRLIADL
ncbi:MAG: glycolate oxidase subunit GlcE [Burkholderiaceae bacterium]